MRFNLIIFILAFFLLSTACTNATEQQEFPNQIPVKEKLEDQTTYLKNWTFVDKSAPHIIRMIKPENPVFDGALLWHGYIETQTEKDAAFSALKAEGFKNPKITSIRETNVEFLRRIDRHPEARAFIMEVEGKLSGKPARANIYTWSGTALEKSGKKTLVHVFMAPQPIYEAMGGFAVNSVYSLDAMVPADSIMLELGQFSPEKATTQMVQLFNSWAITYIETDMAITQMLMGQTMSMNQQLLNSMQSYNNALSQCGGWDCSMSQGADGTWTSTPD